jgi:L-alanine-DL-glutamate epimerase-like enolase superfamily enzyme
MGERIESVGVAVVRVPLAQPIVYRDWIVRDRSYAIVAVRTDGGAVGHAYGLTRDGPVEAIVRRHVAPSYIGRPLQDPDALFRVARGTFRPVLSGGIGLRALSLVDIATWDAAARVAGRSLRDHLDGTIDRLPVMGIVGYPPSLAPEGIADQAAWFQGRGVGHVKLPAVAELDLNRRRMEAALPYAEEVSLDGGWTIESLEQGQAIAAAMPRPGWLEDPVPPDRIDLMAELHRTAGVTLAMGDEQGGPGFPDALLLADAVDVVRIDATCAGGISGARSIVPRVRQAGKRLSFHVFARVHAQIAASLGAEGAVIEWSQPGMLVDPVTESLPMPAMADGSMVVAADHAGLGELWDRAWMAEQGREDPDGILAW